MDEYDSIRRTAGHFFLWAAGVLGLACCLALFQFWIFLRTPGSGGREVRLVEIPPGMNTAGIAQLLREKEVITDPYLFHLLSLLSRSRGKLQAGDYAFLPLSTPEQILEQMIQGRVVSYKVTFPEGSTVRDVAHILAQQGLDREEEILKAVKDGEILQSIGVDAPQLEGYLFPDTYRFRKRQGASAILKAMVQRFQHQLPEGWEDRIAELGLTLHQVVILASLVEKEAVVDPERPVIAAVFLNRLKSNMPLQSDPTAVYDLAGFSGPVTAAHLKRQSPYNTYLIKGLPVGPICSPGSKSIRAALYPEKVPYLYFVSNNDGTHTFSETLKEHNLAVLRSGEKRNAARDKAAAPGGTDNTETRTGVQTSAPAGTNGAK